MTKKKIKKKKQKPDQRAPLHHGTEEANPHAHPEYHGNGGREFDPLGRRDITPEPSQDREGPRPSSY